MKIIQHVPIFGQDRGEPAKEYHDPQDPALDRMAIRIAEEFEHRGIGPDAEIIDDNGLVTKCWYFGQKIIAVRHAVGHFVVGRAYINTVNPDTIPADLDEAENAMKKNFL